jgi:hypothetical protein
MSAPMKIRQTIEQCCVNLQLEYGSVMARQRPIWTP